MRAPSVSTHAALAAITSLARWLPTAPTTPIALADALGARLQDWCPALRWTLVVYTGQEVTIFGHTDPTAQAWISQARAPEPSAPTSIARARWIKLDGSTQIGFAVRNKRMATSTFEALAAQVELAFARCVSTLSPNLIDRANGVRDADQQRERELLQQRANVLSEVLNVGHVLRADRPLADMLTDVAHGIVNALGFRSVTISLRSTVDPQRFEPIACVGDYLHGGEGTPCAPLTLPLIERVCTDTWRISSSFFVPAEQLRPLIAGDQHQSQTASIIPPAAPHMWQAHDLFLSLLHNATGEPIGYVAVNDPYDGQRPSYRTAEAVEIFANQAATTIENVRLFHESQQRLAEQNALNHIQQAISTSLDVRHILREVYAGLQSVLHMDSYYALIYDQDSPDMGLTIAVDEGVWEESQVKGLYEYRGIHAYLMSTRQSLLFFDLRQEGASLPSEFYIQPFGNDTRRSAAWMGVPLIAQDHELIGALSVHSYTPGRFDQHSLAFLQAVGHQVAISFQNVQLVADRERRLHNADVINHLARALAAPIGLDDLADVLFAQITQAVHTQSVLLGVYNRQHDLIEFPLVVKDGLRTPDDPNDGEQRLVRHILASQQALLLNSETTAQLDQLGISFGPAIACSFAGVPLLVDGVAVGVLAVQDYAQDDAFRQHEFELLHMIALQIAAGVEKARLLGDRERQIAQMQALHHIGQATSSTLDLDHLFTQMYTELSRYRPTDVLLLSVCDPLTHTMLRINVMDRDQLYIDTEPRSIAPRSYTDVIMRTAAPILLRNTAEEEQFHGIEPTTGGSDEMPLSWAGVPLLNTSGQPFGLLSMQSYSVGEYDQRDIEFLTNVANQIALNIQNVALFKQSQIQIAQLAAETERLELINRVSSWASDRLDVPDLLQRTVDEMGRMTGADQVRLLMLDRPRGFAVCQAEMRDTGMVGRLALPIKGNPAIEWFDQHGTALFIPDAVNDPRFEPAHAIWRENNICDVLIVPLIVKGLVIGSIGLDMGPRETSFGPRDIATCETIANHVATLIDNAQLWKTTQQSVRELTMLYDLSVSLTTMLDLDEILATLASGALELERGAFSAAMLFDQHGQMRHFVGLTRQGDEIAPEQFADWAMLHQLMQAATPLSIDDWNAAPEYAALRCDPTLQSGVFVPLIVKAQPVGLLMSASHHAQRWTEREQSLLTILTSQAAAAIERATLFQSEQEKRQLADTLRDVAQSLSSSLNLHEVLQHIMVHLRRVVPYDSTSVQLLRDDHQLHIIAAYDLRDDGESITDIAFAADDPAHPNHRVIEARRPYIVDDTLIDYPCFAALSLTAQVRSWLGVPLIYNHELLGMITLDSYQPHFYTPAMADLAFTFATQAAQAIARARLFEQIQRFNAELEQMVAERTAALTAEKDRLEAVHAITTTLTASLDIDEIVIKTLELAAGALGARRGSVLIRDPLHDRLMYRAVLTEQHGLIATETPFNLPAGNVVEWMLAHQSGVCIADVQQDPRWVNIGQDPNSIRSFIAVPLLAADLPLGVIMLNSREIGFFNDEHLRLLATIASEVAIAVHNAELYTFINEQATRLAELLQLQRAETGKNRAILESVAEGVLVLDEQNTVAVYNRAAAHVLQIPDHAIIGQALDQIAAYGADDDERQRAAQLYTAVADGVRNARHQSDPIHALVELPPQTIDTTFTPVLTPDGERVGVAAVLRDITREIESDKTKREFIATVSHELRTPLTSVKGYIDLILLGTAGPINEMQRSFLQVVKSNADRLNGLVEDLLEISRLENGKVKLNITPIDLRDVISEIVASLRTETDRKAMQIEIDIDSTLPTVEADGKRITQVLTNLLSNAHKYTREGGQIAVRVTHHPQHVQIDVSDTGVGIPADELPKMFSRFFRSNNALKDEVGGTGLGLSIAKSFVELHGGDMWVTSTVDVGSTFSFTLPITRVLSDPTTLDPIAAVPV